MEIKEVEIGEELNEEEKEMAQKLVDTGDLTFTNIRFEYNSAKITEESKKILDNAANVINKLDSISIEVQGHTDSDGTEKYNQSLSERRANSVMNYLIKKGVSSNRLSSTGFGETRPIASNDTAKGKAQNRRIEFKVIK
jgi:OOP family OmpA-OmpF porin